MLGFLKLKCYIVGVINKQNVSLLNVKTMNKMISENYNMVLAAANCYAYHNTRSMAYELYVSAGVEALITAAKTYIEGGKATFKTYAHLLIHNAMENEKGRILRHSLPEKDDYDFAKYDCEIGEMSNYDTDRIVKLSIRKAAKNNDRNATILEMKLLQGYELKEIAEELGLSHESVRLVVKKGLEVLQANKVLLNALLR